MAKKEYLAVTFYLKGGKTFNTVVPTDTISEPELLELVINGETFITKEFLHEEKGFRKVEGGSVVGVAYKNLSEPEVIAIMIEKGEKNNG